MPSEICAARAAGSPSATSSATREGKGAFFGGLARSASAAASMSADAEGARQPHAPAARQAECRQHSLEHRLVAERHRKRAPRQRQRQQRMRIGHRARVGHRGVRLAQILDAGLEELVAALAPLAEHLAEIGVAARRAGLAGDVVEADGNGELGPQAQARARLAFGEEDAPPQILARHVEKRIGRLDHRHVDQIRPARGEERGDVGRDGGERGS